MDRLPKRVEDVLFRLRDWNDKDLEILRMKLFDQGFDRDAEIREQAKMVPLADFLNNTNLEKELAKQDDIEGISTGYWTIDRMVTGLAPGDLQIVAAPTSTGKSNLCINMMARQIVSGHKVAFLTLEMSQYSILKRLRLIMGKDYFYSNFKKNSVLVQSDSRMPYTSIKYAVRQAKEWGAEVVYIDHLHYLSRELDNQAEGLGVISKEIKMVAKDNEIPIVLICQLRKPEAGKRPTLDDIRGSALIAQDADAVLILDKNPDIPDQHIRVRVEKNRDRAYLWKVYSETILFKYGLDLEEWDYRPELDIERDVFGKPRGAGHFPIDFRQN